MRRVIALVTCCAVVSMSSLAIAGDVERNKKRSDSGGGNEALTGAVMGGLLGAGLGAAIGSASGRAGTGAAIGAGVGAVGGTLLGANEASRKDAEAEMEEGDAPEDEGTAAQAPRNVKVKKRIVREYDEEGKVISEKEVAQ